MKANDVSIFSFSKVTDAHAQVTMLKSGGFEVSEILEVSQGVNWSNETVTPSVQDDAVVPAWVVIGRK